MKVLFCFGARRSRAILGRFVFLNFTIRDELVIGELVDYTYAFLVANLSSIKRATAKKSFFERKKMSFGGNFSIA